MLEKENEEPIKSAVENRLFIVANYIDKQTEVKPYNTAVIISPEGKIMATTRKHHLFGREILDLSAGKISYPTEMAGYKAGLAICYDTVYTDVCRTLANRGANILFVPNYDPEAQNSLFAHLHSALIAFRAAENGIPIVWSNSSGISTIYDSNGVPVARAHEYGSAAIYGTVHLRESKTIYTRIGDKFACACAGFSIFILAISVLIGIRKSRHNARPVSSKEEQGTEIM